MLSVRQCSIPASELQTLAAGIGGESAPVRIVDNTDRLALAAEALWLFAGRTGLAQDGETLDVVLTDFMADLLHLCRHTGLITTEENHFTGIMQMAEMHCELDEEGDF